MGVLTIKYNDERFLALRGGHCDSGCTNVCLALPVGMYPSRKSSQCWCSLPTPYANSLITIDNINNCKFRGKFVVHTPS